MLGITQAYKVLNDFEKFLSSKDLDILTIEELQKDIDKLNKELKSIKPQYTRTQLRQQSDTQFKIRIFQDLIDLKRRHLIGKDFKKLRSRIKIK